MAEARVVELDALRGLAALMIVAYHLDERLSFGWAAVDLFFVLSGFLITAIVLNQGGKPGFFRTFYLRRILRIWPIYYLTLLGIALIGLGAHGEIHWSKFPYYLTFTQHIWEYWGETNQFFWHPLAHTWSLALEERFYLLWPALVIVIGRRRVPWLCLAVVVIAVSARSRGVPWANIMSRSDGLALGGLLAVVLAEVKARGIALGKVQRVTRGLGWLALGYLAWEFVRTGGHPFQVPLRRPGLDLLALNLCATATVGLVATHAGHPDLAPLRARWLCYVGTISYGLYLYHFPIQFFLYAALARFYPVALENGIYQLAVPALALGAAACSWRWVEQPILRLKGRLTYRGVPESNSVVAEVTVAAPPEGSASQATGSGNPAGPLEDRPREALSH